MIRYLGLGLGLRVMVRVTEAQGMKLMGTKKGQGTEQNIWML